MEKVYSLQAAMSWFLKNASGNVICVREDGEEKECDCYPVAVKFFEEVVDN